jgi:cell division ATPase FtsA
MHNEGKNILVIDVGSGSIGSAVVSIGKTKTITFANRYELDFEDKVDFKVLLNKVNLGIKHSLKTLPDKNINEVHIFMHSPWHTINTKNVLLSNPKEFILTEKLIEQVSQNEIDAFMKNVMLDFPDYGNLVAIESTVPKISIEGRNFDNPFGKKVKNCEFLISIALAPKSIITDIVNICEKSLNIHSQNIKFRSATNAFAHVCSSLYSENNAIMIVDVGSEITDISIIDNKTLLFGISFSQGSNDIVRKISQANNTIFSDSKSLAFISFSGIGSQGQTRQTENNLTLLATNWQRSISESLAKIPLNSGVPKKVVLICEDKNTEPWYANTLKSDTSTQYFHIDGKFHIITPSVQALKNYIHVNEKIYIDASLCLLCITI